MALSGPAIESERLPAGEYYTLTLFAIAGMMMMALATDLLLIFVALEILSLSVYVLTGLRRDDRGEHRRRVQVLPARRLLERVLPLRRRARVRADGQHTPRSHRRLCRLAARCIPARCSCSQWACCSSVSRSRSRRSHSTCGRRTPTRALRPIVTGFMSTGVKAAAFAAFARVFLTALGPVGGDWIPVLSRHRHRDDGGRHRGWRRAGQPEADARVLEHRPRRLSARRSHRRAVDERRRRGKASILFYLLVYAVTNVGAFGIIALLGTSDRPNDQLRDYAGLWQSRPVLAALMTIFLLSLGGFPPMAGFIASGTSSTQPSARASTRWRSSAC